MKDVKIESVNLKIGKKEISLTTEEAKKLLDALQELFKKEVVTIVKEEHHHHGYPWRPYWEWNHPKPIYWTSADVKMELMSSSKSIEVLC